MARKTDYDNWNEKKRAKAWGNAHGYYGMIGGWIYHEDRPAVIRGSRDPDVSAGKGTLWNGKPICQGWNTFYRHYRNYIEAWINGLKSEQEKTK